MKRLSLIASLVFVTLFSSLPTGNAEPRKLPTWGAACPEVVDATPSLPQPKIKKFTFNGQSFSRLVSNGTTAVSKAALAVGCYADLKEITTDSAEWQIGVINRDKDGFYWENAAGASWRLKVSSNGKAMMTDESNPYFESAKEFEFVEDVAPGSTCKLLDVYQSGIRLGFNRNPERISSLGNPKNLIIVTDFSDIPFTGDINKLVSEVLGPKTVRDFYFYNSYGKLDLQFENYGKVIRANEPSASYLPNAQGSFFVNGMQQDRRLTTEILTKVQKDIDLLRYESVSILVSGGAGLGGYFGAAIPGLNLKVGNGLIRNTTVMGAGVKDNNFGIPSWKVLAHELGHLLGFLDFYVSNGWGQQKTPGPFDLMGHTFGSANDFLGWNRWVQGWLDDASVVCDLDSSKKNEITLSAISSNTGKRLYVKPLSSTKALAIEYRTESVNDRLNGEDGLLAYVIDLEVKTGQGPIRLLQSEGDVPVNWTTDVELYATAPLEAGQVTSNDTVIIKNVRQSKESASFVIEMTPKAEKAQEVAKAEQEKVAEVEAKAEADFQARQVAAEVKVTKPQALSPKVKTSITCVKGKVVKKVTALTPKCPTGFKKR
jgi:M6 family metalloprotease-like protein